jgi:hypothetical protein
MQFKTEIPLIKEANSINYNSKLILLGSCFSNNIGTKFDYFKFKTFVNPYGVLYHPLAVENLIWNASNDRQFKENEIFKSEEQWHSFETHSSLSSSNKVEFLESIDKITALSKTQFKNASHIFITFGTAFIYRFIENDTIVANCHKIQQKKFIKELLSINEILKSVKTIVSLLKNLNEKINIIFTVSPVRHLKDGFVENQLSKSHLIAAIHKIISPAENIFYFPSYEILMDDLRDYRYYKEDMVHPNSLAIRYIWEKFKFAWIDETVYPVMEDINSIQKGLAHNAFNFNSQAHQLFLKTLEEKITRLQKRFPWFTFKMA